MCLTKYVWYPWAIEVVVGMNPLAVGLSRVRRVLLISGCVHRMASSPTLGCVMGLSVAEKEVDQGNGQGDNNTVKNKERGREFIGHCSSLK